MAECDSCKQEMTEKVGCTVEVYDDFKDGEERQRLRYGDGREGWDEYGIDPLDNCHDCGVPVGELHHPGCDVERCPRCEHQALSCECVALTGAKRNICAKWGTTREQAFARIQAS
jgi:hypothetical protein